MFYLLSNYTPSTDTQARIASCYNETNKCVITVLQLYLLLAMQSGISLNVGLFGLSVSIVNWKVADGFIGKIVGRQETIKLIHWWSVNVESGFFSSVSIKQHEVCITTSCQLGNTVFSCWLFLYARHHYYNVNDI